jgi:hypothetical protein
MQNNIFGVFRVSVAPENLAAVSNELSANIPNPALNNRSGQGMNGYICPKTGLKVFEGVWGNFFQKVSPRKKFSREKSKKRREETQKQTESLFEKRGLFAPGARYFLAIFDVFDKAFLDICDSA